MTATQEISATMAICLAMAHEHGGKLVRYVGGYWSWEGAPRDQNGHPIEYAGASTIGALVARRRLKYIEWKKGRKSSFPIAVELQPNAVPESERCNLCDDPWCDGVHPG